MSSAPRTIKREVGGVLYELIDLPPNTRFPRETHAVPCFNFAVSGVYEEVLSGGRAVRQPKTAYYLHAGEQQAIQTSATTVRRITIRLSDERLRQFADTDWTRRITDDKVEFLGRFGRIFLHYLEKPTATNSVRLESDGLRCFLWIAELPKEDTYPDWLDTILEFLDSHIDQNPTPLALANMAGLNPTQLVRQFKKYTGCSVSHFLRRKRIELASELLKTTDLSSGEISARLGFADQSHFTKTFQAALGMAPGNFRKWSV